MSWRVISISIVSLGWFVGLAAQPEETSASTIALEFTGDAQGVAGGNHVLGWTFQAVSDITVDSLGIWDSGQDGLAQAHEVGLWTNAGILLASVEIPSGTGSTLLGEFRFEPISPVDLTGGEIYRIAAFYPSPGAEFFIVNFADETTAPEITYLQRAFETFVGGGLEFPSNTNSDNLAAYFGPNFTFVPEPSAGLLLGWGLIGLAWARRGAAHRGPLPRRRLRPRSRAGAVRD